MNESNWQFYRADINSAANLIGSYNGRFDVVWEQSTDTRPSGPLTIGKGYLILPGSRKKIRFYNATTGHYSGYVRTKGHSPTGLILMDSLGYFADGPRKNVLHCVNLLNRNEVWNRPVSDAAAGSIIVNNNLVLSLTEGAILSFDRMTGVEKWTFKSKERFLAPPSATNGRIYQTGDKGTVFVLDSESGHEIYSEERGGPFLTSVAITGFAYAVDMAGNLIAFDPDSDSTIWKASVTGPIWSSPAVDDHRVFVTSNVGAINVLDAKTGARLWSHDVKEVIKSSPIVVGDFVIFGTMSGKLYSFKAVDGTLVSKREFAGAISKSPVTNGQFIYVATDAGELFCLGDTNGAALLHK